MSSGLNHSKTKRGRDCKRSLEVMGPVLLVDQTWVVEGSGLYMGILDLK